MPSEKFYPGGLSPGEAESLERRQNLRNPCLLSAAGGSSALIPGPTSAPLSPILHRQGPTREDGAAARGHGALRCTGVSQLRPGARCPGHTAVADTGIPRGWRKTVSVGGGGDGKIHGSQEKRSWEALWPAGVSRGPKVSCPSKPWAHEASSQSPRMQHFKKKKKNYICNTYTW